MFRTAAFLTDLLDVDIVLALNNLLPEAIYNGKNA